MRAPRHQAEQPCFSARTFIDSVNDVRVALPSASEVNMDQTGRPPGPDQSATERTHVVNVGASPALGLEGGRSLSPPTQLTALKVAEYHVKRICTASIHRLRRETRPSPRDDHGSAFRGKCNLPQQMSKCAPEHRKLHYWPEAV